MQLAEDCAPFQDFPESHYVEIDVGSERRVALIVHCETPLGTLPFWYDDSLHPQRALPLLQAFKPRDLGDYGAILGRNRNMEIFVAMCKVLNDLPDPLVAVQCIQWLQGRNPVAATSGRMLVRQALSAVDMALRRRRHEADHVLHRLMVLRMT